MESRVGTPRNGQETRNWRNCEEKRWENGWGQWGGQKTGVNRGETKGKEAAWCQTVGEGHDDVCPLLMTPTSVQLLCTLCWGKSSKRSGNVWVSPVLVPKTSEIPDSIMSLSSHVITPPPSPPKQPGIQRIRPLQNLWFYVLMSHLYETLHFILKAWCVFLPPVSSGDAILDTRCFWNSTLTAACSASSLVPLRLSLVTILCL